jgi:predicted dehydrogenase
MTNETINRRRFLQQTFGAATAAVVSARAELPDRAAPLKVGFLGSSHSHFREKHRILSQSPAWEVIGVCEEEAAARARGPGEARWISAEALLREAEVIVVESAVEHHARDAMRALRAGRHVHIEKPPAETVDELKEILRQARQRERLVQVGYMWRYHPGLNALIEAAREGWLGSVYLARGTMNTSIGPDQRKEWARFPGGAMFEQGCHLIDVLVRMLGKPRRVNPFLQRNTLIEDGLADNCVAVFEFDRAMGIITSAPLQTNAGPHRFFEVLGTNGTARVQPIEPPSLVIELKDAAGPYNAGRNEVPLPRYQRYVDEFAALAQAIRSGGRLGFSDEEELNAQEALLRAAGML